MQRYLVIFLGIFIGLYSFWGRRKLLTWGATASEVQLTLPSDALISHAMLTASRALTIQASPESVWLWLAQMGRNRTGFYGIDRLDNWNIPSATYLRREISPLEIGLVLDNGLKVLEFSPMQVLVLGGFALPNDMGGTSDISISYRIERLPNNRSRLLVRSRYRAVGRWAWFYLRIVEVLDSLTTIAQLRGIQQRAERMDKRPVIMPVPLVEIDNSPSQFHPASNHY